MPDHAAIVTALILDRPTCLRCMGVKASMSVRDLDRTVAAIEHALVLHRVTDRCRGCGETATTLSIDRPL